MDDARVYYFSGTGNTLALARRLADELGTEPVPMARYVAGGDAAPAGRVTGIVTPVYFGGMPSIVREFVSTLDLTSSDYTFMACTLQMAGETAIDDARRLLSSRGHELHAGFAVRMPSNVIFLRPSDGSSATSILRDAGPRIDEVAEAVVEGRRTFDTGGRVVKHLNHMLYGRFLRRVHRTGERYWTNDRCVGCGLCADVCPVGNVSIVDGRPVWGDACESCMACIMYCPHQAIEYGRRSERKPRYHHPDVDATDIGSQRRDVRP